MKTPDDAHLVGLVAFTIAALCVVAIVVVSIRQRRKTGNWPAGLVSQHGSGGWFALAFFLWVVVRMEVPDRLVSTFPLFVFVPGIDLGLTLAFLAFAGFAISYAFRTDWHWRTGLWTTYALIFPGPFAYYVYRDAKCLLQMPWAWILAGMVAIALMPFFTRSLYVGLHPSRPGEPMV